jgi:hypothetical protein
MAQHSRTYDLFTQAQANQKRDFDFASISWLLGMYIF